MNAEVSDFDYVIKIVLIGESSVGKTNILSRYIKGEYNEDTKTTLGVEFATKLKLQIWDTAGQERYKAVTSSFYKSSVGALVVFDITKLSSFEKVDTWIKELKEVAGNEVVILLVGNKVDLYNQREVSEQQAFEKAIKYGKNLNNIKMWTMSRLLH